MSIKTVSQLLASLPGKMPLVSVDHTATVPEAAAAMKKNHTHLVVVTKDNEPVGVISTADTSGSLANGKRPSELYAFEIMTKEIISVGVDDDINTVSRMMTGKNIGHIVAKTDTGWVILSVKEVLKAITDNEQELQDQFEMYKQSGWPPVS